MTNPEDFYGMGNIKRTLDNRRECCLNQTFSCERPPLLNIPLENIVLDELHLMLRITGIVLYDPLPLLLNIDITYTCIMYVNLFISFHLFCQINLLII